MMGVAFCCTFLLPAVIACLSKEKPHKFASRSADLFHDFTCVCLKAVYLCLYLCAFHDISLDIVLYMYICEFQRIGVINHEP